MSRWHRQVEQVFTAAPGTWCIAVSAEGEPRWSIGGDQRVVAASTIKVGILLAGLRMVDAGQLSLETQIALPRQRTGGSGVLRQLPGVARLSVRELMALMITVSDNTATNILIDLIGMQEITAACRSAGAPATRLARSMMDHQARAEGRENFTTADDQVALLTAVTSGEHLSATSRDWARSVLGDQQFHDRLPGLLPEGTTVLHKTGELTGLRHDVGVIELADGRDLRVAILGADIATEQNVENRWVNPAQTIAEATRIIVEGITG